VRRSCGCARRDAVGAPGDAVAVVVVVGRVGAVEDRALRDGLQQADAEHAGRHAGADLQVLRQRSEGAVGDRVARREQLEERPVAVAPARRRRRDADAPLRRQACDRAVLQLRSVHGVPLRNVAPTDK
jgi:hypothetical protein